jgi:hypothetical protein
VSGGTPTQHLVVAAACAHNQADIVKGTVDCTDCIVLDYNNLLCCCAAPRDAAMCFTTLHGTLQPGSRAGLVYWATIGAERGLPLDRDEAELWLAHLRRASLVR